MGEFELLERIREKLPPAGSRVRLGSGDDAAIVVPGGATATSVDALVDGVHFRRSWSSLEQIGHKALAAALSDLAAMGAEPGEAYVVLGVPTDLDEDGCLELLGGVSALATETGTTLAGGDVTRSPVLTVTMTVVGHASSPEELVTRAGARPGDALVVTGELGGAAAALLLLEDRTEVPSRFPAHSKEKCERDGLLSRQLEPQPRLAAGRALAEAGATAMIDLSDGLGGDAAHIAAASGVGLRIDAGSLPLAAGVPEIARAAGRDQMELAASSGEDYELLAALPPDRFEKAVKLVARAGAELTRIGEIVAGEGVEIRLPDGALLKPAGFDQLGQLPPR
ncbi:MAG TPA: thiamine-phosphate kinase [Solirubrobacterales bacterium]|nr:thiamine-phosphate kinase [Solirubrobacterales bacterium]